MPTHLVVESVGDERGDVARDLGVGKYAQAEGAQGGTHHEAGDASAVLLAEGEVNVVC